jgi:hypothetical protein
MNRVQTLAVNSSSALAVAPGKNVYTKAINATVCGADLPGKVFLADRFFLAKKNRLTNQFASANE